MKSPQRRRRSLRESHLETEIRQALELYPDDDVVALERAERNDFDTGWLSRHHPSYVIEAWAQCGDPEAHQSYLEITFGGCPYRVPHLLIPVFYPPIFIAPRRVFNVARRLEVSNPFVEFDAPNLEYLTITPFYRHTTQSVI